MMTGQERNHQLETARARVGLLSDLKRLLSGTGRASETSGTGPARCFALVRQERLVVGPTTLPYPINHETVLTTSDSVAELYDLCDKLAGKTGGSAVDALEPHNWIDAIPGEKVFSYAIRRA